MMLLQYLKESPEPREHVELATKYLRMIRGDLVARKRNQEKKRYEQEMAKKAPANPTMATGNVNGYEPGHGVDGYGNDIQEQSGYRDVQMGGYR
jgi:hypothetical protein